MSTTATRNLTIEAGTTYRRTLRFYTNRERTVPMDLTGYQIAAQIRAGSFAIDLGIEITEPAEGVAVMTLEPQDTRDVLPGEYLWDMLALAPNGDVAKYTKGAVEIAATQTVLPTDG